MTEHRDRVALNSGALRDILNDVKFLPSCVDFGWAFEFEEVYQRKIVDRLFTFEHTGWLLRTKFMRPDIVTGDLSQGTGRWEFIALDATETTVYKTCWVLAEMIVKHEVMEALLVRGYKLFDPHNDFYGLTMAQRSKEAGAK